MVLLACLQLTFNDGNGNMIQLNGLQSAFYPWSAICSLHFTLTVQEHPTNLPFFLIDDRA